MNKILVFTLIVLNSFLTFSQNELTHVVYFDTGKFFVPPTEENRLLLFISSLNHVDVESISIFGFCDDIGANNYNLALSKKRANGIKAIFANNEISESVITNVDGKGEVLLKIVEEKNVLKIRGLNRKVEIIVKTKPEDVVIVKDPPEHSVVDSIRVASIGKKIILRDVLFKTGYPILIPGSRKVLNEIADVLLERSDIYFTILGHVCCTQNGRDAVNRKTKERNLSEARAEFVYDYLVKKGIDKKRMRHQGLRRKYPLGGDPKFDKRVEILINYVDESKKGGQAQAQN